MSRLFDQGHAVIIGVGEDLPVTVSDAAAIENMLLDTSRCAYPQDQVRLLTNKDATRKNITSALEWLAKTAGPNDTAIIYFSGHGIENPDFYLIPFGYSWKDLPNTAISGTEFTTLLQQITVRKLLVLLDCCHAGGQGDPKSFIKSPIPSEAIEELKTSSGRVIIASSRKNELSWTGNPYSQFTMAVLEGFAGYGASEEDGFARVFDLALHVARIVPQRTGDKQHPILKISNVEDNFAIAWYSGGHKAPKELPWMPGGVSIQTNTGYDEKKQNTWRRMLEEFRTNLLCIL